MEYDADDWRETMKISNVGKSIAERSMKKVPLRLKIESDGVANCQ
jgi:hypothetical protein